MSPAPSIARPGERRIRRVFAPANVISVILGLLTFAAIVRIWDTNRGVVVAALAAGAVTGAAWWAWWHLRAAPDLERIMGKPCLGNIPDARSGPVPTLTAPDGDDAAAYHKAVESLEAHTTGQVVIVASPAPGQGATTVAANLAISATQAGRRVVLVDGDLTTRGLSRFMHTGPAPGLVEVASGRATLAEASRLWNLGEDSRMPVIPAGAVTDSVGALSGPGLADAVDTLTERADLVIFDSSPILWNGAARPLAVHADGTVLVLAPNADPDTVVRTKEALESAGAPVLGYIVNRSRGTTPSRKPWVRALKRSLATFIVVAFAVTGWNAIQLWNSWRSVERTNLDVRTAQQLLPVPAGGITATEDLDPEVTGAVRSTPADGTSEQAFLVIGSDETESNADVIILATLPRDGSPPMMASLPRDLYLPNRCSRGYTRINANLAGCGDNVNGPTLLALAVEDFTGVPIDHFALFDFAGFERIVDAVGGIEICVDHAVRDAKSFLDLPAGCTNASGAQALAWVRSRRTEEFVDGQWRTMPGVNDLARNVRQQDVLIQMFEKVRQFGSPGDLTAKVRSLTDAFTLDEALGLGAAIDLAWELRDTDLDSLIRITIPVRDHVTADGAQVLVPTRSFESLMAEALLDDEGTASANRP